jgi:hypothetical protein
MAQRTIGEQLATGRGLAVLAVIALSACTRDGGAVAPVPAGTGGSSTPTTTPTTTPTSTPIATPTTTPTTPTTLGTTPTSDPIATAATTAATTTSTSDTPPAPSTTEAFPIGPVACAPTGLPIWDVRPASDIRAPELPSEWTTEVVGSSVQGRQIGALVRSVDAPGHRVLVIGGLHGNEPVTPPTVRSLVGARLAEDVEVWLVPEANPDGVAAGSRCNANGVDLNRNFSWGWREDDGGPAPLSEPETQSLTGLIDLLEPDLVVWVHQPYGYVSSIGPTDTALEESWAAASGVAVRPDVTQHGGGESWTAFVATRPSMLIEIDSWSATPDIVAAHRAGFEATLAALE